MRSLPASPAGHSQALVAIIMWLFLCPSQPWLSALRVSSWVSQSSPLCLLTPPSSPQPHFRPSAPCAPSWPRRHGLEGALGWQATWEIPGQKWCQVLFVWPLPGPRMCGGFCPSHCGRLKTPHPAQLARQPWPSKRSLANSLLEPTNYQRQLGVAQK